MQAVSAFKNISVLIYSVLELNTVNKHRTAYFLEWQRCGGGLIYTGENSWT